MTADRLIARRYGALELKQTYQQGLLLGLLAAALLHFGALWGLSVYGGLSDEPPVVNRLPRLWDEGTLRMAPPIRIEAPPAQPPQGLDSYKPIQPVLTAQPTQGGKIAIVDDDAVIAETFTPTEDEPTRLAGDPATPGGSGTGPGSILGIDVGFVPHLPEFDEYVFVTREPEPLPNQPAPVYSEMARAAGADGTVKLRILVSDSGDVLQVVVLNKAGTISLLLVDLATEAVRKWKFKPALQYDRNVAVWYIQSFNFTLR